ncbi:MAG: DEAD/DEAH box helicase, partial [Myxococcales bacterium]|nr:DEAD/DEAH box helicase [Myxococcales bacterium]
MVTDNTPGKERPESPAASAAADPGEAPAPPTFDALPLSAELRESLREMGYVTPTPVQLAVWQPACSGTDCVVQARTGTGKTAAFGLPMVDRLVRRSQKAPQALVLCPTRELAVQVSREIALLGKHREIEPVAIYGGAPMPPQVQAIANGAQIVVATPGRMLDHLRRRTLDPSNIRTLVLDEADEMLSMGFERELNAIMERLPENRQTLLFSATLPPDIERMARTKLRKPEFITLSGDHIGALEIQHFIYFVSGDKLAALAAILEVENPEGALIFCNTREATERLAQGLCRLGYDADWLNGDLPQSDREKTMRAAREGRLRYLVATDVAARGIDISHLTHVINYDFPQDAEAYVHRTGRTGRAGRTGTAVSLVNPQDIGALYLVRLTYKIRPIERRLPTMTEQRTRGEADIVESLCATFAPRGRDPEYRALARRLLTHDDSEAILAGILHEHLAARPELPEEAARRRRETPPPPVPEPVEPARPAAPRREPEAARAEAPR